MSPITVSGRTPTTSESAGAVSADRKDSTTRIAVVGGSGVYTLASFATCIGEHLISTPYSAKAVCLYEYAVGGKSVLFLPRHGGDHSIPPHKINYRANIHALHQAGISSILAINATGGIGRGLDVGAFCVPDQIIDYTWGRAHSFHDELGSLSAHIDFTEPYCESLRQGLLHAGQAAGVELRNGGVYGCTQGPRLETAAEITRMARDGCDLVGQTGMPEAALARELGMAYASLCVVVNRAAGLGTVPLTMDEVGRHLQQGADAAQRIVTAAAVLLQKSPCADDSGMGS